MDESTEGIASPGTTTVGSSMNSAPPDRDAGKCFRVLSLDGGGMRGLYTATYLSCLLDGFAKKRRVPALDPGAAFDLIVGTSTGAIIACAIANGISLGTVAKFYRDFGKDIFRRSLPSSVVDVVWDISARSSALEAGDAALRTSLQSVLGTVTIGELYSNRRIALAIPAIEMEHHSPFVFKTPHLPDSIHRDDGYRLVDVCLASSAAPVYRSLAAIDNPDTSGAFRVFADGGLWANNPVLVGLIDALRMTKTGDRIEIYCLGTCPRPAGEMVGRNKVHRSLRDWKFGGDVATLAIDAQEAAYDHMAKMLSLHVSRDCRIVRFPREQVPAQLQPYLDLDDTSEEAARALIAQAKRDVEMTNSHCSDINNSDGQLVNKLCMQMPALEA
jgi:Patatin-like phospholipase